MALLRLLEVKIGPANEGRNLYSLSAEPKTLSCLPVESYSG